MMTWSDGEWVPDTENAVGHAIVQNDPALTNSIIDPCGAELEAIRMRYVSPHCGESGIQPDDETGRNYVLQK